MGASCTSAVDSIVCCGGKASCKVDNCSCSELNLYEVAASQEYKRSVYDRGEFIKWLSVRIQREIATDDSDSLRDSKMSKRLDSTTQLNISLFDQQSMGSTVRQSNLLSATS